MDKIQSWLLKGFLVGIVGFILTFIGLYHTGTPDWKFPLVIATGFFIGAFVGLVERELFKSDKKVEAMLIPLIFIVLLMVSLVFDIISTGLWKWYKVLAIIGGITYIFCILWSWRGLKRKSLKVENG
ncbi:MAG: hypothetical protein KAT65_23895 [Methanophagales archaeon]|nr:hypothetical protein [Methanophagales archaeon]